MLKFFGYNILKDYELEGIKKDHWEDFKKYLKIKELWLIRTKYEKKPKCKFCDEKRRITLTMPDGSSRKVSCSCNSCIKLYDLVQAEEKYIIAVKGDEIYMSHCFSDYPITRNILFNKKQFKNAKYLENCYFTSKKLAKQALKIIQEQN